MKIKRMLLFAAVVFSAVAASADAAWTDISADIAAREAAWASATVPADSGSYDAGTLGVVEGAAEFVAAGRVFDTLFWCEAYSVFVGIMPKNWPGFLFMVH